MVSELFVTREVIVSCPALLIADDPACQRTLAALTVLDRQVVGAHQAGATEITVIFSSERPKLARAAALGVNFNLTQDKPEIHVPTLLIAANLAVQSEDLERVLKNRGRLFTPDRNALPCGVTSQWKGDVDSSLPKQPRTSAKGVARMVKDGLSAAQAEDALWDTMGLETDSFMDRNFNRPLGRLASKLLIHTRISPNQISLLATSVGVFAAWCFTRGLPHWMVLGAILLQLSAVIDCVDGDIARMLQQYPDLRLRIEGHTDDVGDELFNLKLSKARAESVVMALIEGNVGAERLLAAGFGEQQPIESNATDEGRAKNRRVEFIIIDQE